jgi:hypothetical protein
LIHETAQYRIDTDGLVYGALDIARSTGVTVGNPFVSPLSETWDIDSDSRAERFVLLRARLIPWLIRWKPRKVFIERPMDARAMARLGTPFATQMSLTGMVAIAEATCEQYGIPTELYERQDVLEHFTGVRRYKVKDDGKRACVVRCKQLKYYIEGFDQADAASLWDYGLSKALPNAYALHGVGRVLAKREEDDAGRSWPRPRPGRTRAKRGKTLFDVGR